MNGITNEWDNLMSDSLQVGSFNEERFEEVEAQEDERLVLRFRITNSRVTDIVSSLSLIS